MRRRGALLVLVLLTLFAGCSFRSGAPASESAWSEQADTTLGTALSSLGTARLVLENQLAGRLPHTYAVVGSRDTITVLDRDVAAFMSGQPPVSRRADNRRVVSALQQSLAVLSAAAVAASDGEGHERRQALREVRAAYRVLQGLQDELKARAP